MQKERAEKSLQKLESRLKDISSLGLDSRYPEVFELASQYAQDSLHYLGKGDYFSSFGCSDYSYGLLDALLIIENKKGDFPE
ncbi:DUF357 domain-containing protein [Candidatus Micrarchaeota archaeon]|nr:DUF357 domain-containing protein [Candidatus Micrarchaeota archaeon]MBD3417704.1 DUF357 domain-containing protein [Candidatus Micrarchaeota archaeon]